MGHVQIHRLRIRILTIWILGVLCNIPYSIWAKPELWNLRCSSCHADDTPSCAGCHNHRGNLIATPSRYQYLPGEPVEVLFEGGSKPGWIRALLYDSEGNELDRRSGPTGSGDDARGVAEPDSVAFPLQLLGRAPSLPGTYTWRAAYFGIFHIQNATHEEDWIPLTITVIDPDSLADDPSWGEIKSLYRP